MLNDLIKKHTDGISDYAEIRSQINTNNRISIISGNLVGNSIVTSSGVSARVYKNGVYGFASMGEYSDESIKNVINAARDNALFLDRRVNKGKNPLLSTPVAYYQEKNDYIDVPQKILLDYARELDDYIVNKYPDLSSRGAIVSADCIEKLLHVTTGSFSHTIAPRSCIYVSMSAEASDGSNIELFEAMNCGKGFFTQLFSTPSELYEKIDNLYEKLMAKKEGVFSDFSANREPNCSIFEKFEFQSVIKEWHSGNTRSRAFGYDFVIINLYIINLCENAVIIFALPSIDI